jgi:hypothetical protein
MAFPKPNQQMLLLLSEKNPMWQVLLDPLPVTQENIIRITRKARNVLATWRRGVQVKQSTCIEVFDCIQARIDWGGQTDIVTMGADKLNLKGLRVLTGDECTEWTRILAAYKKECAKGENAKAYALAAILKLGIEDCQKIIDSLIYETRPLFPSFYYGNEEKERVRARDDFKGIGGFYHVWARRGDVWLKAALRVRYVLEMRGGSAIRVKMNFPLFQQRDDRDYDEYDGFVIFREVPQKLYWVFEQRREIRADYWYMITASVGVVLDHEGSLVLAGTYLSTGQDASKSIVSSDVVLVRQSAKKIELVAHLMDTTARVVRKGDAEWEIPQKLTPSPSPEN